MSDKSELSVRKVYLGNTDQVRGFNSRNWLNRMMEELRIRTIVIATQRLVVEDAALLRQEVHREKTRNPGILD